MLQLHVQYYLPSANVAENINIIHVVTIYDIILVKLYIYIYAYIHMHIGCMGVDYGRVVKKRISAHELPGSNG